MADKYDLSLDRLTSRQRPTGLNAGTQTWRDLLFLHWALPIPLAQSLIPQGLELDLYDGQAWIGVDPFEMKDIRPRWLPQAFAFNFLETNVRLYVSVGGEPGVYFLSLEASSWLAVQAARKGWGLPYFFAEMSVQNLEERYTYATHRRGDGALLEVEYTRGELMSPSTLGDTAFFFLERYLLFAQRGAHIYRGQVHHEPYPVHQVELHHLSQDLTQSHGVSCPSPPIWCHASPGVEVEVFQLTRL